MSSSCQQLAGGLPPFISGNLSSTRARDRGQSRACCHGFAAHASRLTGPQRRTELLFPHADGSGPARGMSSISGIAK